MSGGKWYIEDWYGIRLKIVDEVKNTYPLTIDSPEHSITLNVGGTIDLEYRFFNATLNYKTIKKSEVEGILRVYDLGAICIFRKDSNDGWIHLVPAGIYFIIIDAVNPDWED